MTHIHNVLWFPRFIDSLLVDRAGGHMKLHKQVAINKILLCMLINSSCIWRFDSIHKVFVSKNNSNFQPGKLSCDGFIVLKLFVLIFALIVSACDSYEKNEQRDFLLNLLVGSVESVTELKERCFFVRSA